MVYVAVVMNSAPSRAESILARVDDALVSERRWIVLLFVLPFVLKFLYVVQSAGALNVRVPIMDSQYYDRTAQAIAAGHLMRPEAFFMGPLYSYVLGVVYALVGRDFMVVRLLQITGGALSVVLTYLAGRRVFRPSAAYLGALLVCFYGAATFYDGQMLMAWLGTLLDLAMIAVLLSAPGKGPGRYALAGVLIGLSALARANVLAFVPVVVVWIVWVAREHGPWKRAAAFVGAAALTILPATIHNAVASHDFVPVTSNAGLNFFIGNNEDATGIFYPLPEIDFVRDPTSRSYIERALGRNMSPSQISRYWFERALKSIRANPGHEVKLLARKFAMFFNGYEVPQIEVYDIARTEYGTLRILFVPFWALSALGLTGLLFSLRRWRRYFLFSSFMVVYALTIIAFFVTARYRVQVAPVFALFAGHAVLGIAPRHLSSLRRTAAVVGVAAALFLLTDPTLFAMDPAHVMYRERIHRARRLSDEGDYKDAVAEADSAIALFPNFAEGYWQRAIIHRENNDLFKAMEDYSRTLKRRSDLPTVHYDLAQIMREINLRERAIGEYRKAIELNPLMIRAYNNLGITYREVKKYDDAVKMFRKVIELDPKHAKAYSNLGATLAESGKLDEAIDVFHDAIKRFPDYANTYKNLAMAYIASHRPRPALDALTSYLRLEPGDRGAQNLLAKLRIAVRADTTGTATPEGPQTPDKH